MAATGVADASLTTFTIKANGSALSGSFRIEYIDIRRMVNRISFAEIALLDGSPEEQNFAVSESAELALGTEIEIDLGYSRTEQRVFKGILVKQHIQITRGGQSRLLIYCRDACYRMSLAERSAHYANSSDSDVMSLIASQYSIPADIETTNESHTDVVQMHESDWDFMLQRAERNGLVVLTQDGQLAIKSVQLGSSSGQIVYGRNVQAAELQLDAQNQFEETKASAWASANQEVEQQDGTASLDQAGKDSCAVLAEQAGGKALLLEGDGDLSATTLLNWANAAAARQQLAKIIGTLTIQGSHDIDAGSWVELQGFGARFNGQVYVGGVMHSVSRGNWLTTVQVGLQPQWHMQQFSNSQRQQAFHPQTTNLHIAKVVALSDDPDGAERIQVKIMALGDEHEGVWARLASMDAGSERGWVVRPEIDDEVIVGFIDGDAAQPIVLGSLFSSANAAPVAADDDNHEKGWVTRAGTRFIFNDDKISLTIETPNGNTFEVSDDKGGITLKDENDNSIVLDSNGITMSSASDLNIEAQGDVTIKGLNITQEAQAEIKLTGSAGAKLESGGNTVVKGALVQIN
ncbi:type VI secretion system tip protein VgrG [Thalassolituus oleivorans]|uniref:type VI secretion system tip protein VgrG n=1 Tax=Thalassolituus oleivorans TaxID=187493 RepID=UPI0023F0D9DE|nr:type VI secretion system tip protein VgrG [Thalassolituus oleivorans]